MRKSLVLIVALAFVLMAAHKPSGPVIVDSEVVTVPTGTSFGPTTIFTPTVDSYFEVHLDAVSGCGSGGGGVFWTDPNGASLGPVNSGSIIVGANQAITWTGGASSTSPCTLYLSLIQI